MNHTVEAIKQLVREKYGQIAAQSKAQHLRSCCGTDCCATPDDNFTGMADSYAGLTGYEADADLGLGCGLPTQFAGIQPGGTVVDLGAGAGNDCFVARAETGATGRVIGVDMTEAMVEKARRNAEKLGYTNVEFLLGEIENLPLDNNLADVVLSNCVLNLVPDKRKAFAETFRILKPGGHFSISDVVLEGDLPAAVVEAGTLYAGCVSGALQKAAYLNIIAEAGFGNVCVQKQKAIYLPDEILRNYLSPEELAAFRNSGTGIYSITVYAKKGDH
jgi:ubiquinone/menaquinone biosynthesis C-methylase UbiE